MATEQIIILTIIFGVIVLFILGRWRHDVIAFLALTTAVIFGVVEPSQAFSGFGHPATVTVALVLILSHALIKSSAVEWISKLISPLTTSQFSHTAALAGIAAVLSMFMNNVGALALLMPVAMESANKSNHSPASILMPMSFGSILGGLVTLIGTPPNVIIATYRANTLGTPFNMFDFSPVGGITAIIGLIFITFFSGKLLRVKQKPAAQEINLFKIESYISEVKIPKDSALVGKFINEIEQATEELNILIVSLIRKKQRYYVVPRRQEFCSGDILLLEGGHNDLDHFTSRFNLNIISAGGAKTDVLHSKETDTIEIVVAPMSKMEGRTVEQISFKRNHGVNLLAISRQGKPYRGRIHDFRLRVGDVLLLHGENEQLLYTLNNLGCLPLAERGLTFGRRKFAYSSLGLFLAAIACTTLGLLPIHISLGIAVILMAIFNILPLKELYDGIDWPVVVLLGTMLPLGSALESTGTTDLIASGILHVTSGSPSIMLLLLVLVITMTLSDILSNAATAIFMAPIGYAIATHTGTNPDTFLMTIAVGASCAFLTPIGHQNNALIMGPGGYNFGDYWHLGLPLEILIVATCMPAVLFFWPLY